MRRRIERLWFFLSVLWRRHDGARIDAFTAWELSRILHGPGAPRGGL